MRLTLHDPRRLAAGLIFVAIGVFAMTYGSRYRMGTATHMGPGYFPFLVAAVVAGLGLASAVTAFRFARQPASPAGSPDAAPAPFQWHLVPLLCILAGIIGFGLVIEHLGLVIAVAIVVLTGCYQRLLSRPGEVAIIGLVLLGISVGLFIHGLGMPWQTWPQ
jgi:hypothetical protein